MLILGIDTSCDDTCISIIKVKNEKSKVKNFEIISNVISSQVKIHSPYGGVYPLLAKREHQRNLPMVFKKALNEAGISISKFQFSNSKKIPNSTFKILFIDFIGVTIGPGLEPCLWQGINFVKDLAKKLNKPIIPVNHIEAHILANLIGLNLRIKTQNMFPAVCLVVSGGHTQLILMLEIGKYKLIGETRDDAAGECFDKTARILGLGYPGGPAISASAASFKKNSKINKYTPDELFIKMPRPMIYSKDYDFSFSGLKTAVLYDFQKRPPKIRKSQKYIQEMSYEIQQSIIDVLIKKTLKAAGDFKAKSIILGGGVAANNELRRQFKIKIKNWRPEINFFVPPKILCTDNGAMVATTSFFYRKKHYNLQKISANANLSL